MRNVGVRTEEAAFEEQYVTLTRPSIGGPLVLVNCRLGTRFSLVVDANCTLVPQNGTAGQELILRFQQDGTGSRTITPDARITFPGAATSFHVDTAANAVTIARIVCSDAGAWESAAFFPTGVYDAAGTAAAAVSAHEAAGDPHPVYSTAGEVSAAIAAHEAAGNPHAVYLTQAEGDALYHPKMTQGAAVPDPAGGATVDAEARTAVAAVIARLEALGLVAS